MRSQININNSKIDNSSHLFGFTETPDINIKETSIKNSKKLFNVTNDIKKLHWFQKPFGIIIIGVIIGVIVLVIGLLFK